MSESKNAFEQLLEEMADAGVDESWIGRLEAASAGSPLRQEIRDLKAERDSLRERTEALTGSVRQQTFKEAGITMNPDLLKLPDDLDVTDVEAVKAWGIEQKLLEPQPSVSSEELEGQDAITNAGAGAAAVEGGGKLTPAIVAEWPMDRKTKFMQANPDAWEALKRGEEVVPGAVGT